ncbi:MAG: LysM peptidoglycan-binding domain-containing protein [Antricoccus sp.]
MVSTGWKARVGVIVAILMTAIISLDSPWSVLLSTASKPQRIVDSLGPDVIVLALITALLQILGSWLLIVIALTGVQTMPGSGGLVAQKLVRRIAPRVLRTMASTVIGLTLLPATAYAAQAATPISATVAVDATVAPNAAVPDVDWPQTPGSPINNPDLPSDNPETTAQLAPTSPAPPTSLSVTVHAGDCLWSIAAAVLGPGAATAQISVLTEAIYDANSALIGPNPDFVIAGQVLIIPT